MRKCCVKDAIVKLALMESQGKALTLFQKEQKNLRYKKQIISVSASGVRIV